MLNESFNTSFGSTSFFPINPDVLIVSPVVMNCAFFYYTPLNISFVLASQCIKNWVVPCLHRLDTISFSPNHDCSNSTSFTKGKCYCGLVDQLFLRKRILNWMPFWWRHLHVIRWAEPLCGPSVTILSNVKSAPDRCFVFILNLALDLCGAWGRGNLNDEASCGMQYLDYIFSLVSKKRRKREWKVRHFNKLAHRTGFINRDAEKNDNLSLIRAENSSALYSGYPELGEG